MAIFSRNKEIRDVAHRLFSIIVAQARKPEFYADWQVADTLDGRFDLIVLHVILVVNRLQSGGQNKKHTLLIRYVQEVLFDNMDMSLRELGVGDMGVGKKVKVMAGAYYGRMAAYSRALETADLAPVVIRNIYREQAPDAAIIDHFTAYIYRQVKCLENQTDEDIMAARLTFEAVI
ncbi:MAG: hypothetical protein GXP02_05865 [Alphaproteobacteria bacterium]|nr:hypothetical protein [Alphaproteobacteria bacterium]